MVKSSDVQTQHYSTQNSWISLEPAEVWAELFGYHSTGWLAKCLTRAEQYQLLLWSLCSPFAYNSDIPLPPKNNKAIKKTLASALSLLAKGAFWVVEEMLGLARSNHTCTFSLGWVKAVSPRSTWKGLCLGLVFVKKQNCHSLFHICIFSERYSFFFLSWEMKAFYQ